jgi:hypothetical protein
LGHFRKVQGQRRKPIRPLNGEIAAPLFLFLLI